jgi:hypothetical protein
MSGNEIALTLIIVITACAVVVAVGLHRSAKVPRNKP